MAAALAGMALLGAAWVNLTTPAPAVSSRLGPLPADPVARGERLFRDGDLGVLDLDTLETNALPWVVLSTALALEGAQGDAAKVTPALVEAGFASVGFLFPRDGTGAGLRAPLGLNLGRVERLLPPVRVTAANLGCASCHAGVGYDAAGRPQPGRPVPGMPNTSLDLEAYAQLVYRGLKRVFADEPAFWRAVARLHPTLSWREQQTLRWIVLPRARTRMAERAQAGDTPLPFSNGAPGLTNGVAALKFRLGLVPPHGRVADGGFVSIPDLADRQFRSALLADGAYVLPGRERFRSRSADEAAAADPTDLARIGSFFTVPSMGMSPERARDAIPALTDIARYLARYRPQAFPGPVDRARLPLGRAAYARDCAGCHGDYDDSLERPKLLRFPNWAGDVGTDMGRAKAFDAALAARVNATVYRNDIAAAATGRLAAPLLAGVWASAPYFVNGSVPTLRHLLDPATRPARFMVGGHRLDFARVGLALEPDASGLWRDASGYRGFAGAVEIDARRPGFSNRGHEEQVRGLSAEERDALLDYLKLL
jgi:mono/diheme cytochrome c family protein